MQRVKQQASHDAPATLHAAARTATGRTCTSDVGHRMSGLRQVALPVTPLVSRQYSAAIVWNVLPSPMPSASTCAHDEGSQSACGSGRARAARLPAAPATLGEHACMHSCTHRAEQVVLAHARQALKDKPSRSSSSSERQAAVWAHAAAAGAASSHTAVTPAQRSVLT